MFNGFFKRQFLLIQIICFSFFMAGLAFASHINKQSTCPTQKQLHQLAEQSISSISRIVGVSLAISHPRCGSFTYTFGEANILKHIPMREITKLPMASNTKAVLTALALIVLEENPHHFPTSLATKLTEILDKDNKPIFTTDGKVKLLDGSELDLADPEFFKLRTGHAFECKKDLVYQCPNFSAIDFYHLLLESSGLADYIRETDLSHDHAPEMMKFLLSKLYSPLPDPGFHEFETDLEALKKFGLVKKANQDPIMPTQSHNTDASLLTIILERVTGLSLNELLVQKILNPLKLEADSMKFVTKPISNEPISRQYVLLNTDDEVETAITSGKIFPLLNQNTARKLKPSFLKDVGRKLYNINLTQSAIDALDLHGQGIFGFPGPGGLIAQPKAYVKFYQALASGKLLSKATQSLFDSSFLPQPSNSNEYRLATGYGSNDLIRWTTSTKLPRFLTHGGFVPGGESLVTYNYDTGFTIMIATNTSGSWRNMLPMLFVTPTAYFDKSVIWELEKKYAELFNVF